MNSAKKTIDWLYRQDLQVDKEWSVNLPQGFVWWPDQNAQRIEVIGGEGSSPTGEETFHIRVKTELLRDLELNQKSLSAINHDLMSLASMSGPVYDAATGVLSLSSLVRTYESIRPWMSHMISLAAVLQFSEACALGSTLADTTGARLATSGHPKNGVRPAPDELAEGGLQALIAAEGAKPCAWIPQFRNADEFIHNPPCLEANSDKTGFTAEFPWGELSSLCEFKGNESHPRYGHGLLIRQSFPLRIDSEVDGIKLALELNAEQLDRKPAGYGFGTHQFRNGCLSFVGFFPNFINNFAPLNSLYLSSIGRAQAMSIRFAGDDWSNQFAARRKAKSATQRMAETYFGAKIH